MSTSNSGNRGQRGGSDGNDRPRQVRHWSDVRPRTLRLFVRELIAARGLRGAEALAKHSKEGLRQIADGKVRPNYGTRKKLAELFLELYPDETLLYTARGIRKRLIEILPPGEPNAKNAVTTVLDLARRSRDELPSFTPALQQWLLEQIEGEYDGDRRIFRDPPGRRDDGEDRS